jgi:hypothetical protein
VKTFKVKVSNHTMTVIDRSEGRAKIGADAAHTATTAGGHMKDAACAMTAMRKQCRFIVERGWPYQGSVLETFGGSGWETAIIREELGTPNHIVWDFYQDCVDSIAASLPGEVEVKQADSYAEHIPESDWIVMDFNSMTFHKFMTVPKMRQLVARAAAGARRWISISDSAMFGLKRFKKNLDSYARMEPGITQDWTRYFSLWQKSMAVLDFQMKLVLPWNNAAQMLFERSGHPGYNLVQIQPEVEVKILTAS